jgi:ParB-like nuclease domain
MNIQNLPLSQLVPSPANVRKTDRSNGIEQLAASIKAHGLLQNVQVKEAANGQFEVVAGGRRLAALRLLAKHKEIEGARVLPMRMPRSCWTRSKRKRTDTRSAEPPLHAGREVTRAAAGRA